MPAIEWIPRFDSIWCGCRRFGNLCRRFPSKGGNSNSKFQKGGLRCWVCWRLRNNSGRIETSTCWSWQEWSFWLLYLLVPTPRTLAMVRFDFILTIWNYLKYWNLFLFYEYICVQYALFACYIIVQLNWKLKMMIQEYCYDGFKIYFLFFEGLMRLLNRQDWVAWSIMFFGMGIWFLKRLWLTGYPRLFFAQGKIFPQILNSSMIMARKTNMPLENGHGCEWVWPLF